MVSPKDIRPAARLKTPHLPTARGEVEAAWAAEIERRARRVMAGETAGVAWEDVRRRGEAALHKR